jgi:hypothetical protein
MSQIDSVVSQLQTETRNVSDSLSGIDHQPPGGTFLSAGTPTQNALEMIDGELDPFIRTGKTNRYHFPGGSSSNAEGRPRDNETVEANDTVLRR